MCLNGTRPVCSALGEKILNDIFSRKVFKKIAYFLLIPSLFLNIYLFFRNNINISNSSVFIRDVIDGDTLVTGTGSRIRLMRVDAPELQYCFGQESKDKLYELTVGNKVILKDQTGDSFGRVVALVYVGNTLVNEVMLREGFLRYQGGSSSEKDKLQTAGDEARANKLGIYSEKCRQSTNPDDPKCSIKGNIDKSNGKKTYHFPGCSGYESNVIVEKDLGEQWFCSEKEAKAAGFVKSENCYGKTLL